jgi:hypothetical protein
MLTSANALDEAFQTVGVAGGSEGSCTEALRFRLTVRPGGNGLVLRLLGTFANDTVEYSRKNFFGRTKDACIIEYGVKGGQLRLWLRNATAPLETRFQQQIPLSVTAAAKTTAETAQENTGSAGLGTGSGGPFSIGAERKHSQSYARDRGVEYARATVTTSGNDAQPKWHFDSGDPMRHLSGSAPGYEPPLAELAVHGKPVDILAAFLIWPSDLHIIHIHGVTFDTASVVRRATAAKALPGILAKRGAEMGGRLVVAFASASQSDAPGGDQGIVRVGAVE